MPEYRAIALLEVNARFVDLRAAGPVNQPLGSQDMKPSRIHYFVAGDWPSKIWATVFPVGFACFAASSCWQLLLSPTRWTDPLFVLGYLVSFALLGYFVSILVGWPILGPLYYARSLKNGEPFHIGDKVQVLSGPHRDRIVRVVNVFDIADWAGGHRIEVELGAAVKEDHRVFRSTQVLRVESAQHAEETREPEKAMDDI